MSDPLVYPIGRRIVISGHGGWPDGTTGTIAEFPNFVRSMRGGDTDQPDHGWLYHTYQTPNGPLHVQWVEFDQPTDDGSGDGPYRAGEVGIGYLRPLDPGEEAVDQ